MQLRKRDNKMRQKLMLYEEEDDSADLSIYDKKRGKHSHEEEKELGSPKGITDKEFCKAM